MEHFSAATTRRKATAGVLTDKRDTLPWRKMKKLRWALDMLTDTDDDSGSRCPVDQPRGVAPQDTGK